MPPAPAAPGAVSGGARAAGYKPRSYAGDPSFGAPTKTDTAALKRQARQRDTAERQRYETEDSRADGAGGRSQGRGGAATGPGPQRQARPTNLLRGQRVVAGGTATEEGAGVLLGLVLYALLLAYIQYGTAGVSGWFGAKFLNKPFGPAVGKAPPPLTGPPSPTGAATYGGGPTPGPQPPAYPAPTTIPVPR